jgi:signal transduction histidine kinase
MSRSPSPELTEVTQAPQPSRSRLTRALVALASRPHLPRRTVRLRLTLLYGALFIVSGAALLTITYVLVVHSTGNVLFLHRVGSSPRGLPTVPQAFQAQAAQVRRQAEAQHTHELHQLLIESGLALAIMSVLSLLAGWVMAGRVLTPLRTMTATTQRISEANLHQRLALDGPRDELKELADTIDGLLARLETAFEAQRRFVANASHELRTPLTMMRTSLDVATGKPAGASVELTALEHKLREGLDQADRLVESFLTLARAQHGAVSDRATVELPSVAQAALDARRGAIAARGLSVQMALGPATVTGNRTLLAQMVENVLDNAVRHNQAGGWIRVHTESERARARVTVESGGAPLSAGAVAELAQPFQRIDGARRGSEHGVGLGLSIVDAIAQAHGGALSLEAQPCGGLRVVIDLPTGDGAA